MVRSSPRFFFFFFNDTATTEIYTLSLHDALPILIVEYLEAKNNFGMDIQISREEPLLDTGGGLKKAGWFFRNRSEEHTSELQSRLHLVCRLLLEKKKNK